MKKLLLVFALLLYGQAANAQAFVDLWNYTAKAPVTATNPLPVTSSGGAPLAQASMTCATANVPNTSTTVTLVAASHNITVKTDPAAAVLYVDIAGGTATIADFRIDPGAAMTWTNTASITAFKIIGASATGTYSVSAW